jgi:DNA-binding XRE family transcriptional regulator
VLLQLVGGLRAAEVCGLEWKHVTTRDGVTSLTVRGKGRKTRRVVAEPVLVEALERAQRVHTGQQVLANATPLRVWKWAKEAAAVVGRRAEISSHDLRRSNASLLRRNGADLEQIRTHLGHANVATTTLAYPVYGGEMTATTGLSDTRQRKKTDDVRGGNNTTCDAQGLRLTAVRLAPCRAAVQFAVAMRQENGGGEAQSFTPEDCQRMTELCEAPVALSRLRAFLSVLEAHQVVRRLSDGPLGDRYVAGPEWDAWQQPGTMGGRRDETGDGDLRSDWWRRAVAVRDRLRLARERAGLTQAQAAARIGGRWTKERVWKIEQGHRPLTLELVVAMAEVYGIPYHDEGSLATNCVAWVLTGWQTYSNVYSGRLVGVWRNSTCNLGLDNPQAVIDALLAQYQVPPAMVTVDCGVPDADLWLQERGLVAVKTEADDE